MSETNVYDRLVNRPRLSRTLTFFDDETSDAATAAKMELLVALRDAGANKTPAQEDENVTAARAEIERTEQADEEACVHVTLIGLKAGDWPSLLDEHPPTPEQAERGEGYNADRFAPALVAACSGMTPTEAADLIGGEVWDETTEKWVRHTGRFNMGEAALLFQTAVSVNQGARVEVGPIEEVSSV